MISIDEWKARQPPPEKRADRGVQARALSQAAARMEALTGDPTWDHFASYLEAEIKIGEARRDAELGKLRNPGLVNDEAIRVVKAHIVALDARVATLKEVLLLPKYLKDRAALAVGQIDDLAKGA